MTIGKPKISVIMPTFNYGQYLTKSVSSVIAQTRPDWELLIIDNYSKDETSEILNSFKDSRVRHFRFQNQGSIGASRNYGVKQSNGELIAFLDSDDYWYRTKLDEQVKLHEDCGASITFHDLRLFGRRMIGRAKGFSLGSETLQEILLKGNPILTSSAMIQKSAFISAGGFPEGQEYVSAEDLGLWLRLAEQGVKFQYLPRTLGGYRVQKGSSSSSETLNAAKRATNPYRKLLSVRQRRKLDGWLAYGEAAREQSRQSRRGKLKTAIICGSFKIKWRAILRFASSF